MLVLGRSNWRRKCLRESDLLRVKIKIWLLLPIDSFPSNVAAFSKEFVLIYLVYMYGPCAYADKIPHTTNNKAKYATAVFYTKPQ